MSRNCHRETLCAKKPANHKRVHAPGDASEIIRHVAIQNQRRLE